MIPDRAYAPQEISAPILARFQTRCGACRGVIFIGDEIVTVEGEWCHEECVYEEEEAA